MNVPAPGFLKVKSSVSSRGAHGAQSEAEPMWWEFRHEMFRRGRKDLLPEIKRREDKRATHRSSTGGGKEFTLSCREIVMVIRVHL